MSDLCKLCSIVSGNVSLMFVHKITAIPAVISVYEGRLKCNFLLDFHFPLQTRTISCSLFTSNRECRVEMLRSINGLTMYDNNLVECLLMCV